MLLADRRKADSRLLFRTTNPKSKKRIFERGIIITEKPVKTAINEIASGKVIIVESQEQD